MLLPGDVVSKIVVLSVCVDDPDPLVVSKIVVVSVTVAGDPFVSYLYVAKTVLNMFYLVKFYAIFFLIYTYCKILLRIERNISFRSL